MVIYYFTLIFHYRIYNEQSDLDFHYCSSFIRASYHLKVLSELVHIFLDWPYKSNDPKSVYRKIQHTI